MLRIATISTALIASMTLHANAAVTIVGQSSITPIEELAKTEQPYVDSDTGKTYDRAQVKLQLFERYKTVQNMVMYSDRFSEIQKSVLQELLLSHMEQISKEKEILKQQAKIQAIKSEQANQNEAHATLNDPDVIKQRRIINANKTEAEKVTIFESKINIDTERFDPNSDAQLNINNRVNRPSVLAFFDITGQPYTITSFFPTETDSFEFVRKGTNQLLISAKESYGELSGFVFLENEPQAIPVLYTSNPKRELNVKKNIILPTLSPTSSEDISQTTVPLSQLNNSDDPVMYQILHGRPTDAKQLKQSGLPRDSSVYRTDEYTYIRTRAQMRYDIDSAINVRGLYVYRAHSRQTYWFDVNNQEQRVTVYE